MLRASLSETSGLNIISEAERWYAIMCRLLNDNATELWRHVKSYETTMQNFVSD